MGKVVTLLKPFVFSPPSGGENHRLTSEQWFRPHQHPQTKEWIPTEVELPDEVAAHPYISEHFADGRIERPDVTAARLAADEKKRADIEQENAAQLRKANDALKRASGAHEVHQRGESKVTQELNTPVNELGAQRGKDVNQSVDPAALEKELNTPVNELGGKSGKKSAA